MPETQIECITREGLRENELLMSVPHTRFLLRCTAWKNGNFRVQIFDPDMNWEREVWRSIGKEDLMRIYMETMKPEYSYKSISNCRTVLRALREQRCTL